MEEPNQAIQVSNSVSLPVMRGLSPDIKERQMNNFDGFEPPAETRVFAKMLRDMYVALQKEGFTQNEALRIIGQVIAGGFAANGGGQGGG
jgi:hypothetical protein